MRYNVPLWVASLFAVSACSSIFDAAEPEVSIQLASEDQSPLIDRLEVHIGQRKFHLTAQDEPATRTVTAARTGALSVRVRLIGQAGDTLAHTAFSQRFHEDSNHWIAALVGTSRPLGFCIGDLIVVPLEDQVNATPDTLFLMHGSIPKNAIC